MSLDQKSILFIFCSFFFAFVSREDIVVTFTLPYKIFWGKKNLQERIFFAHENILYVYLTLVIHMSV